jgi:iron-sulfur cluster repair protein YtfE (RIC family)
MVEELRNLLQSTLDCRIKMNIHDGGVGNIEQWEGILSAYHTGWSSALDALKCQMGKSQKIHSDHEAMIANLTKGILPAPMKSMSKMKQGCSVSL